MLNPSMSGQSPPREALPASSYRRQGRQAAGDHVLYAISRVSSSPVCSPQERHLGAGRSVCQVWALVL